MAEASRCLSELDRLLERRFLFRHRLHPDLRRNDRHRRGSRVGRVLRPLHRVRPAHAYLARAGRRVYPLRRDTLIYRDALLLYRLDRRPAERRHSRAHVRLRGTLYLDDALCDEKPAVGRRLLAEPPPRLRHRVLAHDPSFGLGSYSVYACRALYCHGRTREGEDRTLGRRS